MGASFRDRSFGIGDGAVLSQVALRVLLCASHSACKHYFCHSTCCVLKYAKPIVQVPTVRALLAADFALSLQSSSCRHSRLVKLAMVYGFTLSAKQAVTAATNKGWQSYVASFLSNIHRRFFTVLTLHVL